MTAEKKNIAASVHQLLKNQANENGEDFNLLLIRFANERLLYRLSLSKYQDRFLLKGASLLNLWFDTPHRPTRDIDLLGFGSNEIPDIEKIFSDICKVQSEDGLIFHPETVKGYNIKEGEEYQGVRVLFLAFLGNARMSLQIDVGFGDVVTPNAEMVDYPTILDFPAPQLQAYPKETVLAEKFEAMVKLGIANSRMKDFWDLRLIISEFEFDGYMVQKAVQATFARRQTTFPKDLPLALTEEFAKDIGKQTQWKAFLRKNKLDNSDDLDKIIDFLSNFFLPIIKASNQNILLNARWQKESWYFLDIEANN